MSTLLEIVYEDEELIAINKPHGLLVHRSAIARDVREFALQSLRDQVGYKIYTTHRLDRKTSGILLFSKNKEAQSWIQKQFQASKVEKTYEAIVRGYVTDSIHLDYPLINDKGKVQAAESFICPKEYFEIPLINQRHNTSRYTRVEVKPITGRYHQIRKHMAHLRHPIIGDRPHGCNKQNKLWKEQLHIDHMMLHASKLCLIKLSGETIMISAKKSEAFAKVQSFLKVMNNY